MQMNPDWNTTIGGVVLRIIWLAVVIGLLYAGLRWIGPATDATDRSPAARVVE